MLFLIDFGDGPAKSLDSDHNLEEQLFVKSLESLRLDLTNLG